MWFVPLCCRAPLFPETTKNTSVNPTIVQIYFVPTIYLPYMDMYMSTSSLKKLKQSQTCYFVFARVELLLKTWAHLCGVCIFSLGSLASSHSPKTCKLGVRGLTGHSKLVVCLYMSALRWTGDLSRVSPAFAPRCWEWLQPPFNSK